jgi:PIN domain nuclease of toxin-antitoxin system
MNSPVLDTCAVLDLAADRWSDAVARIELERASDPIVLAVSVWEMARQRRVGKLKLPCAQNRVLEFVLAVCDQFRLRLAPLTGEVCEQAELLPPNHEDPFDRMILAAAISAGAPVFTIDPQFRRYDAVLISYR